jgi:hypothetical protein
MTNKIFGIGLPRTGTRSLAAALEKLGYRTAHYLTVPNWLYADFETDVLTNWDALTDTPAPIYFPEFDKRYPGSKFILSTRDSESWLKSIKKHQAEPLTDSERDNQRRVYRLLTYGMCQFSVERYRYVKESHEMNVAWYFRVRQSDLLTIDICGGEGWNKLCAFLGKPIPQESFPVIS